jgi:hypothetical protein
MRTMKRSEPVPVRHNAWDTTAYFQKALKDDYGFEVATLDPKYQSCFIRYGAFSKNRDINEKNVGPPFADPTQARVIGSRERFDRQIRCRGQKSGKSF